MNIYAQLETIVLPYLEIFKDDLLVHDKKQLNEFSGPFLYGYRKTGTSLIKLYPDYQTFKDLFKIATPEDQIINALYGEIVFIVGPLHNTNFLYFDGKKLNKITAEKATRIFEDHCSKIVYNHKLKQQVN